MPTYSLLHACLCMCAVLGVPVAGLCACAYMAWRVEHGLGWRAAYVQAHAMPRTCIHTHMIRLAHMKRGKERAT